MVIYIDNTVAYKFSKREPTDNEKAFFEKLALARREGKCWLSGSLESISKLCTILSGTSQGVFSAIKSHYSEDGSVFGAVDVVFTLTFSKVDSLQSLPKQIRDKVCFVCIEDAVRWKIDICCHLVTENLHDAQFYEIVAKNHRERSKINGLTTFFHKENGGGSTIADVLDKCVCEEKSPTLCIVDSDMQREPLPDDTMLSYGETCISVLKRACCLSKLDDIPPYYTYVLKVHEIENLIPICVIRKLREEEKIENRSVNIEEKLLSVRDGKPLLYYDFKKGLRVIKHEQDRAYWQAVLLDLGGNKGDMPPMEEIKVEEGTSVFFPPIDKNILMKAIDCIKTKRVFLELDSYLEEAWEKLGRLLFSWGCAGIAMKV